VRSGPLPGSGARGYGAPVPPALGAAALLGLSALRRAGWLVAPGVLVALLRRGLGWTAVAVAWALLARGAATAAALHPLDPLAPVEGALEVATSGRVLALVGGLWAAGVVLGGVLRVAYLAGALPTLAGAMSAAPRPPRFAAGVAYGLPRVLGAAMLGLAADVAAMGFAAALAVAAAMLGLAGSGLAAAPRAGAIAGAVVLAVLVPQAIGAVSDVAVARAAVSGDGPARAFAEATRRFLARPGTFTLAALGFALLWALGPNAVETLGGGWIVRLVARAPPAVVLGPQVMLALAALVVAALVELWWMGTAVALGCADDRPA
jgi:hypothetical protein